MLLSNLKSFYIHQKLLLATFSFIITHLMDKNDKKPLSVAFSAINLKRDGLITKDEIKAAWIKYFDYEIE